MVNIDYYAVGQRLAALSLLLDTELPALSVQGAGDQPTPAEVELVELLMAQIACPYGFKLGSAWYVAYLLAYSALTSNYAQSKKITSVKLGDLALSGTPAGAEQALNRLCKILKTAGFVLPRTTLSAAYWA